MVRNMQTEKKLPKKTFNLLEPHIDIQRQHQQILEDLLSKPDLHHPSVIATKQQGLFTPNQLYQQKMEEKIKKQKIKK